MANAEAATVALKASGQGTGAQPAPSPLVRRDGAAGKEKPMPDVVTYPHLLQEREYTDRNGHLLTVRLEQTARKTVTLTLKAREDIIGLDSIFGAAEAAADAAVRRAQADWDAFIAEQYGTSTPAKDTASTMAVKAAPKAPAKAKSPDTRAPLTAPVSRKKRVS